MTSIHAVGGCGGGRLLLCRSSQSTKQFEGGSEAGDCEALNYTFLTPIKPFFQNLWDPPPLVHCLFVSDSVWCRPATLRAIKMFSGTSIGFTRSYPPCTVVHQAVLISVEKSILYLSSPRFSKLWVLVSESISWLLCACIKLLLFGSTPHKSAHNLSLACNC